MNPELKIIAYGFDGLGFNIPTDPIILFDIGKIEFISFADSRSWEEADGVIIPQGIFEDISTHKEDGGYVSHVKVKRELMYERERQVNNLLSNNKWACFLVEGIVDSVPHNKGRQFISDTDLCKRLLNKYKVRRDIVSGLTELEAIDNEFKEYVTEYGMAKTIFTNLYSNDYDETKRAIVYEKGNNVGVEILNKLFILPFHTAKRDAKTAKHVAKLVTESINNYRKKRSTEIPSIAGVKDQLSNLELLRALNTCRIGTISLDAVKPELDACVKRLYDIKAYEVILRAYHGMGEDGWKVVKGLPESKHKYWKHAHLREEELLSQLPIEPQVAVQVEEELTEKDKDTPKIFQLKPIITKSVRTRPPAPEPTDDPYILSQAARVKLEKANATHKHTLGVLKEFLQHKNLPVSESKLLDAYSVLSDGPAIFEVKSITETNENNQIRHALSQLYEYRFLHSIPEATLWVVFSQAPSSLWCVEYLTKDRGVNVIWLQDNKVQGPSIENLR